VADQAQNDETARRPPQRVHVRILTTPTESAPKARGPGGLLARLITGVIAGSLVAATTYVGGSWFVALVLTVAGLSAWEISVLQRRGGVPASPYLTLGASWSFPLAAAVHETEVGIALLGLTIVGGLIWLARAMPTTSVATDASGERTLSGGATMAIAGWGLSIASGLYVGVLLAPSISLRERADGLGWLALILGATWACDTAAYFVGRQWGAHKLAPSISPQKSIEGTVAGFVAATVAALAGGAVMGDISVRFLGLGLIVAGAAIVGDLAESVIKRHLGAKDSGWIMPGHGGLLDRIDSLLFSSFFAYWYILITDRIPSR